MAWHLPRSPVHNSLQDESHILASSGEATERFRGSRRETKEVTHRKFLDVMGIGPSSRRIITRALNIESSPGFPRAVKVRKTPPEVVVVLGDVFVRLLHSSNGFNTVFARDGSENHTRCARDHSCVESAAAAGVAGAPSESRFWADFFGGGCKSTHNEHI